MTLFIVSLIVIVLSGITAALMTFASGSSRSAIRVGAFGCSAGCLCGFGAALAILLQETTVSMQVPWALPGGTWAIAIDGLSAWFLLPTFFIGACAALYGIGYLADEQGRRPGLSWLWFTMLIVSMALVIVSRNGVLFLIAWELMALTSFFLVMFHDERRDVRDAGWLYLVATHCGTIALIILFILLGRTNHSFDFDQFVVSTKPSLLFLLALFGFGVKAGCMPFHVWLPEAHPAAPAHVSALMSAVMIKTGIYAFIRMISMLGTVPLWWSWCVLAIGIVTACVGIVYALAQSDLKRLLAYSSIENCGIIFIGIGMGLLGMARGQDGTLLALFGWSGALLHVLNHACAKGLAFLGAGAIDHAAKTRDMDFLGGLMKRMPRTGVAFVVSAWALAGLPPFSLFVSEFLLYCGVFTGIVTMVSTPADRMMAIPLLAVVSALAAIGCLAVICYAKAVGVTLLGLPRSEAAEHAHECSQTMHRAMTILVMGCVLLSAAAVSILIPGVAVVRSLVAGITDAHIMSMLRPLLYVVLVMGGLVVVMVTVAAVRTVLLARREQRTVVTWDCGYEHPTTRMQYTGSSLVQPVTSFFTRLLALERWNVALKDIFPAKALFTTTITDSVLTKVYRPVVETIVRGLIQLRWLQHGRLQLYILYIGITLIALFVWKLR